MLEFTCSTYGKRVQGDESLAGQHVQCPGGNAAMTAPAQSGNLPMTAIASADHAGLPKASGETAFSEGLPPLPEGPSRRELPQIAARWAPYVAAAAIVLVLSGVLIVGIQKARAAAELAQSKNNLKQMGLAFQEFHDLNKRLPFNGTRPAVAGDNTSGSWAFMILPFVDRKAVFTSKDTSTGVAVYMCPARGRPLICTGGGPGAWTDYFLNPFINDPNGAPNAPDIQCMLGRMIDGTSNTIIVGHGQINPDDYSSVHAKAGFTDTIFNGGSPGLCRPNRNVVLGRDSSDPPSQPGNWGGPFPQGALMCFADGTVMMRPYTMRVGGPIVNGTTNFPGHASMFAAQLTPNGGEEASIGPD